MFRRVELIGKALPTLTYMFDAFTNERNEQEKLFREVRDDLKEVPEELHAAVFEALARESIYTLFGSIAVLADNVTRIYAREVAKDERARRDFGTTIYGEKTGASLPVGTILWAAANAARHYAGEPFRRDTEAAIASYAIVERDESVPYRLLFDIAKVQNVQTIEAYIDTICEGIECAFPDAQARPGRITSPNVPGAEILITRDPPET